MKIAAFVVSLLLCSLAVVSVAPASARPAPQPPAAQPPLVLDLTPAPKNQLSLTFRNQSSTPLALNLGTMLGNGLHPTNLTLLLTDDARATRSFQCKPFVVGGSVDDWIIPLAPGDAYTLLISPDNFLEEKTFGPLKLLPGTRLAAHFNPAPPAAAPANALFRTFPRLETPVDSGPLTIPPTAAVNLH